MNRILFFAFILLRSSCSNTKKETSNPTANKSKISKSVISNSEKPQSNIANSNFEILFNNTKVSKYTIVDKEYGNSSAIVQNPYDYTAAQLERMPRMKRLTLYIVIPTSITKENLSNTFCSFVSEKYTADNELDEIVIFAFDNKTDIGNNQYTFGKSYWGPIGKPGSLTSEIIINNNRSNYAFDMIIKDKVGNIQKKDMPTQRELEIYTELMHEKYIDLQEEKYHPLIMKKFKIKTKKELDAIWLKVAVYKN